MSRIVAVAPALPEYAYTQAEIAAEIGSLITHDASRLAVLSRFHAASGIGHRHTVLPLERYKSIILPTPMSSAQAHLPIKLTVYDKDGKHRAEHAFGNLKRSDSVAIAANDLVKMLAGGYGHMELSYDFSAGEEADGWLHALFRYEDRSTGHAARYRHYAYSPSTSERHAFPLLQCLQRRDAHQAGAVVPAVQGVWDVGLDAGCGHQLRGAPRTRRGIRRTRQGRFRPQVRRAGRRSRGACNGAPRAALSRIAFILSIASTRRCP